MSEVLVAAQDAAVTIDDVPHVIQQGVTMARDTHPIVTDHPGLWKPLDVTYDVPEPEPEPEPDSAAKPKTARAAPAAVAKK